MGAEYFERKLFNRACVAEPDTFDVRHLPAASIRSILHSDATLIPPTFFALLEHHRNRYLIALDDCANISQGRSLVGQREGKRPMRGSIVSRDKAAATGMLEEVTTIVARLSNEHWEIRCDPFIEHPAPVLKNGGICARPNRIFVPSLSGGSETATNGVRGRHGRGGYCVHQSSL